MIFPGFFSKSQCPTAELRALLHQRREQLQVATQHGTGHGAQTEGAPEGLPGGRGPGGGRCILYIAHLVPGFPHEKWRFGDF